MKKIAALFLFLLLGCLSAEAASRFAVCTTTCTWDAADTTMWSASSGGATGASVPGSGDTVTLDAATCVGGTTCTITVNTTVDVTSITMGACTASTTGCILTFATNNNNSTVVTWSITGTGTRTLRIGNGTHTITSATGTIWDATTTTNLTFNANASTIVAMGVQTSQRTFTGGGLTYNNFTVSSAAENGFTFVIASSNTFVNLTIDGSVVRNFRFGTSTTQTVSGTFSIPGTTSTKLLSIGSTGVVMTVSVANAAAISWTSISAMTKAGAGSITCTNCFNGASNTGITFIPPNMGSFGGYIIGGG